jgi:hypothetical protein
MTVNNNYYRFSLKPLQKDTYMNIPVELSFDLTGREDAIDRYEKETIDKVINPIDDFETTRFMHAPWDNNPFKTEIHYQFNFFDSTQSINNPTSWLDDYQYATFTDKEIYFFSNSFKGSFFKLDFYDTNSNENGRAFISVIIPVQQGLKEPGLIGPPLNPTQVDVKKPKFILDYLGADKEGFFIYWLKEPKVITNTEFYMSAKFFNGKTGSFLRMMNKPQSDPFFTSNKFNFNKSLLFYYKVKFDFNDYEYKVYSEDQLGNLTRVGDNLNPIKWYEYVNP